jgi:hypothetical protein
MRDADLDGGLAGFFGPSFAPAACTVVEIEE